MTRPRLVFFSLSAFFVLLIIGGGFVGAARSDDDEDSLYKYLSVFTEVLGLVRQAYVEDIDLPVLMAGAMDATTEALDPFSMYLPPGQAESFPAVRDLGVRQSGLTLVKDRGIAFVASVELNSPAAEAGLEVSDIVAKIQGRSTRLMPIWRVHRILAGTPGTEVDLEVIRIGERENVSFALGTYQSPMAGLEMVEGVNLLRLGGLRPESLERVRSSVAELVEEGDSQLLVDLRGVANGDPQVAYDVASLLVEGDLGFLDRRGEHVQTFSAADELRWRGELVVLVDRATLGAGEILASVLRQGVEAHLVGERTFGYAGKLELVLMATGGSLLISEAFFTGPDGEPIRESLAPDVLVTEASRRLEEKDLPLHELILRRGLRHLLDSEPESETARQAA